MANTISRKDLKAKIDRGDHFTLVEASPEESFQKSHLPGAINLPTDQVRQRAAEVLPDRNAEIVVYCAKPT
jgi:rhodanese-related sulfurtransferase